jgi:hypothetical protein
MLTPTYAQTRGALGIEDYGQKSWIQYNMDKEVRLGSSSSPLPLAQKLPSWPPNRSPPLKWAASLT